MAKELLKENPTILGKLRVKFVSSLNLTLESRFFILVSILKGGSYKWLANFFQLISWKKGWL